MALALSRKKSESIIIGIDEKTIIKVTLANLTNSKATISIEAPKHIPIYREEIWNKRQKQRIA
jgi:carbon storage regulator CsrA